MVLSMIACDCTPPRQEKPLLLGLSRSVRSHLSVCVRPLNRVFGPSFVTSGAMVGKLRLKSRLFVRAAGA